MVSAMALLAMGYFFTVISVVSILSYYNKKEIENETGKVKRVYTFHKGFWGMTFPMGTMSLGNEELYVQYNQYVPLYAFRVLGTIYGGVCVCWSILCLLCTLHEYSKRCCMLPVNLHYFQSQVRKRRQFLRITALKAWKNQTRL